MAEGLELVTVTEPMPPDLETGVVRQPARRSAKSKIPQRRRDAEAKGEKFIVRYLGSVGVGMGKIQKDRPQQGKDSNDENQKRKNQKHRKTSFRVGFYRLNVALGNSLFCEGLKSEKCGNAECHYDHQDK